MSHRDNLVTISSEDYMRSSDGRPSLIVRDARGGMLNCKRVNSIRGIPDVNKRDEGE